MFATWFSVIVGWFVLAATTSAQCTEYGYKAWYLEGQAARSWIKGRTEDIAKASIYVTTRDGMVYAHSNFALENTTTDPHPVKLLAPMGVGLEQICIRVKYAFQDTPEASGLGVVREAHRKSVIYYLDEVLFDSSGRSSIDLEGATRVRRIGRDGLVSRVVDGKSARNIPDSDLDANRDMQDQAEDILRRYVSFERLSESNQLRPEESRQLSRLLRLGAIADDAVDVVKINIDFGKAIDGALGWDSSLEAKIAQRSSRALELGLPSFRDSQSSASQPELSMLKALFEDYRKSFGREDSVVALDSVHGMQTLIPMNQVGTSATLIGQANLFRLATLELARARTFGVPVSDSGVDRRVAELRKGLWRPREDSGLAIDAIHFGLRGPHATTIPHLFIQSVDRRGGAPTDCVGYVNGKPVSQISNASLEECSGGRSLFIIVIDDPSGDLSGKVAGIGRSSVSLTSLRLSRYSKSVRKDGIAFRGTAGPLPIRMSCVDFKDGERRGRGDAFVLKLSPEVGGDRYVLVDTGFSDYAIISDRLRGKTVAVVVTHRDSDHIGGLRRLIGDPGVAIEEVLIGHGSVPCRTKVWRNALADLRQEFGEPSLTARALHFRRESSRSVVREVSSGPGTTCWEFGGFAPVRIKAWQFSEARTENDGSILVRAQFEDRSILLTSDATPVALRTLAESIDSRDLRSGFLKWPHHVWLPKTPSDRRAAAKLLKLVDPHTVIFSNTGHASHVENHAKVEAFIRQQLGPDVRMLWTEINGNVEVITKSDGPGDNSEHNGGVDSDSATHPVSRTR